jgi:hypothetical protein
MAVRKRKLTAAEAAADLKKRQKLTKAFGLDAAASRMAGNPALKNTTAKMREKMLGEFKAGVKAGVNKKKTTVAKKKVKKRRPPAPASRGMGRSTSKRKA